LGRNSASEGTFWDDMVRFSRGCPAIMQSAIFLSQRKMKNEAMLLVVSAKAPIFQFRRSGERRNP
jgi:hypothetical protein